MKYVVTIAGTEFVVNVEGTDRVAVEDRSHHVDLHTIDGEALFSLLVDSESYEIFVERHQGLYHVMLDGRRYVVQVEDERMKRLSELAGPDVVAKGELTVEAPMPGRVVDVLVESGDGVETGQGLVILEAMKMENEIRSPREGTIKSLRVSSGQTVDQGQALVVIE